MIAPPTNAAKLQQSPSSAEPSVSPMSRGEPRGMDGWMGMTNREEQEVRRGKRKKKLPSPRPPEKLASESIMSDERDTTVCTTSYPIPPTLLELERPKVDNMLRSFSLSLLFLSVRLKLRRENSAPPTASFLLPLPHFHKSPLSADNGRGRCGGNELVLGFGKANFAWRMEITGEWLRPLSDERD